MPTPVSLDVLPLWAIFAISFAVIVLAAELGHRFGRLRHRQAGHEKEPTVGGIVAAELGLFAFLLAFTFGLAASRFEARRQTLLDEANAIGTTYLRAKMLPEPQQSEAQKLLREYVDVRLAAVQERKLETGTRRSTEIHDQLWNAATAAAGKDPRSVPTGLFIQSLNELIDLHAKRIFAAVGSRVPAVVWLVLFMVAILSFGSMGYNSGLTGAGRSPVALPMALAFAIVMWMVVDLDRPQAGLLRVSQKPLVELRSTMGEAKP
jgi:hypothetical protein